ncbi:MAG: AAA family ATPase, partial [Gemmatimonadales bacterium]
MTGERVEIIGRERELSELAAAFDEARDGRGGCVLVSGEAGVGLTRLAEEAVARSGFHKLAGRAREEATPSYAPIASALRDCLRAGAGLQDCGPLAEYLTLLLPEMGAAPRDADPETLTEAMAGALAAQARRTPTALLLDDLQWADNATLELLPTLDERLRTQRLLVVGTYRSDEIVRRHPVRRMRNALRRARRLREIAVSPLKREHTGELVAGVIGAPASQALVDLIHAQTQGLPLYIEELAGALASSGALEAGTHGVAVAAGSNVPIPESVRDAVLIKLDRLSEPARLLVEIAAVTGTDFDVDVVGALARERGVPEDGFDELLESGF